MAVDKMQILKKALQIREELGIEESSPIDIFALVQNIPHLSLVLYPLGKNISGMCIRIGKDTVIAVNSGMSVGRQNFTIAHELYHFYFDETGKTVICNNKVIGGGNTIEQNADQFASYFLIPLGKEIVFKDASEITFEKIIESEQYYKVSNQAMLYRLVDENIISQSQADLYKKNVIKTAESLGFDISLYCASDENKLYKTYGYYIKQSQQLKEKEMIADSKYEQLLIEAFRSDIVFGDENEVQELDD